MGNPKRDNRQQLEVAAGAGANLLVVMAVRR